MSFIIQNQEIGIQFCFQFQFGIQTGAVVVVCCHHLAAACLLV